MRSKIQWFTEVCKSHCIAHFAASFIVVRTNAFVAGSHQIESIQVEIICSDVYRAARKRLLLPKGASLDIV